MQFTTTILATILAAAASALPSSLSPRQTTFTELATFSKSGCQSGDRIGTVNLADVKTCQTLPSGINSGRIEIDIPAGCSMTFFLDSGCTSPQTINIPRDQVPHRCFEMGAGKQLNSFLVSGTCS
ncbi:uncharacterized protein BDR25DRAFT_306904 [Lindgomyces ingoldianus]|uniref:Uncharacterized protein n=1 Tax=Lindgomyces ingoldianus TaxID=673940 RepID=A0ACB6QFZ4_9PLEO|nr:uncharacterized protein BDR25DRAFT_306904 [Lindgomyces ingoldianus]KAF2465051.1 hypothetical protein BDR25DRAFT_306904 [Lindgomyces ingoldianus]